MQINEADNLRMTRSIDRMVKEIGTVLSDCVPSIYLYGSCVLGDFKLGWSDIDILVLTQRQISLEQAEKLVVLRQFMLQAEPNNLYYRSIEGGMLTLSAFLTKQPDRVVYWGTSGQRIADTYYFDSFCMTELLESGVLLYGEDVRRWMKNPDYSQLYTDVKNHYDTIRKYVQQSDRSLYSFGWFLDIARCIYTLQTGKIIAKTDAGAWALENNLCPIPEALEMAFKIRCHPMKYKNEPAVLDYAETLGPDIQRFADVLERKFKERTNIG